MRKISWLYVICHAILIRVSFAAEPFVLTETQLAKNLSVSKGELQDETYSLSKYLSGQSKLLRECQKNASAKLNLCSFVIALETFREEKPTRAKEDYTSYTNVPYTIKPKTFAQAQKAKPSELLDRLKSYSASEVLSWLPELLTWRGCPQN